MVISADKDTEWIVQEQSLGLHESEMVWSYHGSEHLLGCGGELSQPIPQAEARA